MIIVGSSSDSRLVSAVDYWKAQGLGMTQEELAEEMCTTKSMISYYENDHGDMKQSMIAEFAVILETTVEYLACGVIKESARMNLLRRCCACFLLWTNVRKRSC